MSEIMADGYSYSVVENDDGEWDVLKDELPTSSSNPEFLGKGHLGPFPTRAEAEAARDQWVNGTSPPNQI